MANSRSFVWFGLLTIGFFLVHLDTCIAIGGGRNATPGEFPYVAQLLFTGDECDKVDKCGAAIVSPTLVLTAAHCVDHVQPESILVLAGELHWGNTWPSYLNPITCKQLSNVSQIIVHPNFNKLDRFETPDLALLVLATPLRFTGFVKPIRLPTEADEISRNVATILGWGLPTPNLGILQAARVSLVELRICERDFNTAINHDAYLCVGASLSGRGICARHGDAGGPLIYKLNDGTPILHGIASFSEDHPVCGDYGQGFVRVTFARKWILDEMKKRNPAMTDDEPTTRMAPHRQARSNSNLMGRSDAAAILSGVSIAACLYKFLVF